QGQEPFWGVLPPGLGWFLAPDSVWLAPDSHAALLPGLYSSRSRNPRRVWFPRGPDAHQFADAAVHRLVVLPLHADRQANQGFGTAPLGILSGWDRVDRSGGHHGRHAL